MHRYSYPHLAAETRCGVLLDLVHGIGSKVYHAELTRESATRVSGMRATHGWAADREVYFVIEFSRLVTSVDLSVDGNSSSGISEKISGKEVKAIFGFQSTSDPLIIRVGLSCTSVEGAAKNLHAEIPHWNFDAVAHDAEEAWSKAFATLDADLSSTVESETFYTGAYRGLVAPATFNDVDGSYRGQDHQNHPNPGFTKYTGMRAWKRRTALPTGGCASSTRSISIRPTTPASQSWV